MLTDENLSSCLAYLFPKYPDNSSKHTPLERLIAFLLYVFSYQWYIATYLSVEKL